MLEQLKEFFKEPERDYCFKVKNLSVNYGRHNVLKNLSFTIDKRDVFGIIGLSGSGKSTLLKALLKFTGYQGFVDKSKSVIGYCPQEGAFFEDLTIKENVLLFGNLSNTPVKQSLRMAGRLMKELKLKKPLDKMVEELSGGERKRVNIILSILHDPGVVVLDEPFAGLDYLNRLMLWDFIKHLKSRGKTVILTTHLLNEAQKHCNNLLILSQGRRFAMGSISDIKRSLRFQEFINVGFDYLNKDDQASIRSYCKKRGFWVLGLNNRAGSFGLPSSDKRRNLVGMIKRLGTDFEVVEYRPPTLNELFMVSAG